MSIFGEETIPAPGESPEIGHEEPAAVETEEETADETIEETADTYADDEQEADGAADPEEGHSDDPLNGKFKSPADMAKAYQNAVRKMTQLAQENRQLKSQQPQGQQPPARDPGYSADTDEDPAEVVRRMLDQDPIGTINYFIQRSMAPLQEERATNTLAQNISAISKEYPQARGEEGMATLLGKVAEIFEEIGRPELVDNPPQRFLRLAAEEAFGSSKADLYRKAKAAGREEAEATRRAKSSAATPRGARPQTGGEKSPEQQIRENIVAAGRTGGLFG